ncbi:CpaE family protein [Falsiroseomonas sp.]|uniref:AAA family ATPase n=1 Tax=Falsiroseomonas sp. TaxID=2870721 RepID=UPI003566255F
MNVETAATLRTPPNPAQGASRAALLAFIADEESEEIFRAGLGGPTAPVAVRRGNIRAAISALSREPTPRVLVVDLSGERNALEALDRLATVCAPDVVVLAVGDATDIEFYRLVRQDCGVTEYLPKPLTRDNVLRLFAPHIIGRRMEEDSRGGRVVAVCGVRGGVGATTLAVNLAATLSDTSRNHVALLDLHLRGGTAAMLLGVEPTAGLRTAMEDADRIDHLFVERIAVQVSDRLQILSADEPPEAEPAPSQVAAMRLIEQLRTRFNVVVVDMPWPPGPVERTVLRLARQRVLVFGPDLAGVRDAAAARAMLRSLGDGLGPVLLALNGADAPGRLDPRMIAKTLGGSPEIVIPWLPKPLAQSAMLGRAAVRHNRALRRALLPLAVEVGGAKAPRRGFFGLFGSRR